MEDSRPVVGTTFLDGTQAAEVDIERRIAVLEIGQDMEDIENA